jgi:hypothetical protein
MSEWSDREESVVGFINALSIDWELDYFDSCNLVIIGNYDLTYYHTVEILFEEVSYIQFSSILFERLEIRIAEPSDRARLHLELDVKNKLFAISCPDTSPKPVYFIASERIKARACMVYHYLREKSQPCVEKWNQGRYQESIDHRL